MLQRGSAERHHRRSRSPPSSSLLAEEAEREHAQPSSGSSAAGRGRCKHVGGRAWVSQKGVDYLVEAFLPVIVDEIEAVEISPKTGSAYGFSYSLNNFEISNMSIASPRAYFRQDEGLGLDVQGVSVQVKLKYRVEGTDWWNPIWSSGTITAVVSQDTGGTGVIRVGVSPIGNPVLNMTVETIHTTLKDLQLSGTRLSAVIEFISSFVSDYIGEMIATKIKSVIEWFINDKFNSYLDVIDLKLPLPVDPPYNISALDASLCAVHIGTNYIGVDTRAEVVDLEDDTLVYPVEPLELPQGPPMTVDDFESSMFAAALTKWTINSGLWLYQTRDLARYTLMQSDIPENSPIVLSAEYLRPLVGNAPGVPPWYWNADQDGKKKEFAIEISSNNVPAISFSSGRIQTTLNTTMAFKMQGVPTAQQYAFSIQAPIRASAGVHVEGGKVTGELQYVSSLPIKLVSAVSRVSMFAVSAFIEILSATVLVPLANMHLGNGYPIPTKYGITALNTSVQITDMVVARSDVLLNTKEIMDIIYGEDEAEAACPAQCSSCSALYDEFGERRRSGDTPLVICEAKTRFEADGCAFSEEEEVDSEKLFKYICKRDAATA